MTIGKDGNVRRSSIFRYQHPGERVRDMGIGSLNDIGLAEAREIARKYRVLAKEGRDPIRERDAAIAANLAASATVMTFDEAAAAYIAQHRSAWSNPVHAAQWPATIKAYASPVVGKMNIGDVTTAHVMKVLEPIWATRTQTAKKLRARKSRTCWAGLRRAATGPAITPARWKGHLENLLAKPSAVYKVQHMPALSYADLPAFMAKLRARTPSMASLALETVVLTAVRSVDIRSAKRAEVDLAERVWNIREFSKTGKPHRVPLSDAAIDVIERARQDR